MAYQFTPEQELWLRDLETTEEPQTKGYLHKVIGDQDEPAGYCCLGRACVVLGFEERLPEDDAQFSSFGEKWADTWLPDEGKKTLRLRGCGGDFDEPIERPGLASWWSLADLNDAGWSFKQIAAYIREHPENVFLPPEEDK